MKKKFFGRLSYIHPSKILHPSKQNDLDDFVLQLSVVYNTFKNVLLLNQLFEDTYESPRAEADPHSAEFAGVIVFFHSLIIGYINEFFQLIPKYKSVIGSYKFQLYLLALDSKDCQRWRNLYHIASGGPINGDVFARQLYDIRNNVSFHFNNSRKELPSAFRNFFFRRNKNYSNQNAAYSIGKSMADTRFYFADAILEEFMNNKFDPANKNSAPASIEKCAHEKLVFLVDEINHVLFAVICKHLENKNKGK